MTTHRQRTHVICYRLNKTSTVIASHQRNLRLIIKHAKIPIHKKSSAPLRHNVVQFYVSISKPQPTNTVQFQPNNTTVELFRCVKRVQQTITNPQTTRVRCYEGGRVSNGESEVDQRVVTVENSTVVTALTILCWIGAIR